MNKTFSISHPVGIELTSELKESELWSVSGVKERDMYNGWVWYDLPTAEIQEKSVIFSISFFKKDIRKINIGLIDPDLYGSGWDEWSEEKELLRIEHIREWLTAIGYKSGKYSWGEVWVGYDSKGGSGYGSIRFPG